MTWIALLTQVEEEEEKKSRVPTEEIFALPAGVPCPNSAKDWYETLCALWFCWFSLCWTRNLIL